MNVYDMKQFSKIEESDMMGCGNGKIMGVLAKAIMAPLSWIFFCVFFSSSSFAQFSQANHVFYEQWLSQCKLDLCKKQFFRNLLFCIAQENSRISRARFYVKFLIYKQEHHMPLSAIEKKYLRLLYQRYNVFSSKSLLERMDVIPASLALAQAIIESGWGKSPHAVKRNAFFGMIKNGRCLSFDTPQHCVTAYIHNLNKHKAYKKLWHIRACLRRLKQVPQGVSLIPGLGAYCPSETYLKKIKYIIEKYQLYKLDGKVL
jgi:uncharacterized FlgJ-related protein